MANFVITHAKSDTIADWSGAVTVGNSSGGTETKQASDLVRPSDWNSAHSVQMTLSASDLGSFFSASNGLSISTNTNGVTVYELLEEFFEPFPLPNTNSTLNAFGLGTWYIDPFMAVEGMQQGRVNFFYSQNSTMFKQGAAISHGTVSKTANFSHMLAIYSQVATNTTQFSQAWSGGAVISATQSISGNTTTSNAITISNYLTVGVPFNINTAGAMTSTTYTASGTASAAATTFVSSSADSLITAAQNYISGSVMGMAPFTGSLAPGNYWMAHAYSHTSGTAGLAGMGAGTMFTTGAAYLGLLENQLSAFKMLGKSTVGNSSSHAIPMHGFMSTSSLPVNTMGTAQVTGGQVVRMYWNYFQDSQ